MGARLGKVRRSLKKDRIREVRDKKARMKHRKWRWEVILGKIPTDEPCMGVEVGVLKGATARRILEERPLCTHIMVDPWHAPGPDERYAKAPGVTPRKSQEAFDNCYESVKGMASKYGARAVVIRDFSAEAAEAFFPGSLDYVFIDAEHTYEGVSEDIRCWLPKVRAGGWIGGHDYGNEPSFPGVRRAVDEAFPEGVELCEDHTWFKVVTGG